MAPSTVPAHMTATSHGVRRVREWVRVLLAVPQSESTGIANTNAYGVRAGNEWGEARQGEGLRANRELPSHPSGGDPCSQQGGSSDFFQEKPEMQIVYIRIPRF